MLYESMRPVDGRIVFADLETTGLIKERRQIWEAGLIIRDPGQPDVEVEWQIRPDLTDAEPDGLRIGRYYRRSRTLHLPIDSGLTIVGPGLGELDPGDSDFSGRRTTSEEIANCLARILDGAYLVGAVISFDELSLHNFLRTWNQALTTHYRIRCVETMALGFVHGLARERQGVPGRETDLEQLRKQIPGPPWDTEVLSRLAGVEPPSRESRHRALVDARWARDIWDAITGYKRPETITEANGTAQLDAHLHLAAAGEVPASTVAN